MLECILLLAGRELVAYEHYKTEGALLNTFDVVRRLQNLKKGPVPVIRLTLASQVLLRYSGNYRKVRFVSETEL